LNPGPLAQLKGVIFNRGEYIINQKERQWIKRKLNSFYYAMELLFGMKKISLQAGSTSL